MTDIKLTGYYRVRGKICCISGLHIGGSSETIEIGGMDNPVIKHPITGFPYIPGSSLKGKMRSLLEWELSAYQKEPISNAGEVHKWCGNLDCPICRIFGISADEAGATSSPGPTRLLVRDALLDDESIEELMQMKEETGLIYAEEKWENTINRLNARANPRQMERVPADINFNFELSYRLFRSESGEFQVSDEEMFKTVRDCLKMVELDALGGSGSRGYGKIEFEINEFQKLDLTTDGWQIIDIAPDRWWDEGII